MKRYTMCLSATALLLSANLLLPLANANPSNLLGDPAPNSTADRTLVIGPSTTYVNVTGGEVIKFVVGNKTFTWDFDASNKIPSFDLSEVAPAGLLDHKVTVYVARDPDYFGGP